MKALVVTEEAAVAEEVTVSLGVAWPQIDVVVSSGGAGVAPLSIDTVDMVILDTALSETDAFQLLKRLRRLSDVPIITLTDGSAEMDRVRSLELGADDYVVRPYGVLDFVIRARAVMRRATPPGRQSSLESTWSIGKLTVNLNTHEALLSGEPLKLTPLEYELLCSLARNEGKVLHHDHLLEQVWGPDYGSDRSSLKKYVQRLRAKLSAVKGNGVTIVSHRGIGYSLKILSPGAPTGRSPDSQA